ncbi:MAG: alpha/beta hydrolase fold domain-containing protein [Clostridia bacterium]|nr:alpha/beta hydrolase fold domain-containing protein [Clostridia bacterium]
MAFSAKTTKKQLSLIKPIIGSLSIKSIRKGQDMIGELMESRYKKQVIVKEHSFENFDAAWVLPKDERREGVILYMHGGGYACGSLDYALGFGSMLASVSGTLVFCVSYRLAPEDPYPAALDDALEAYKYLISKGYGAKHITLCGESAGGGLCYSLCLKLRENGIDMPCGVIALSPWTDLTLSGKSYKDNKEIDPSMSEKQLKFYADSYAKDKLDPFVSPVFADLEGMPPSLIFVGSDEIMLDDSKALHARLSEKGCDSTLIVAKDRWHTYLLYGINEDKKDIDKINEFLDEYMSRASKLRWLRLDNAAKIYPAARDQNWSNVFRLSMSLKEDIDVEVLKTALDVTVRRFPSIAVRLRKGAFWYYLEQLSQPPQIREESCYPLTKMSKQETRKCALRVIVYRNRIAVEIFHSITDGTGGLIFLKSLVAEYLQQKYGMHIEAKNGVLGRLEEPSEQELEDSFQKYAGSISASRKELTAWKLRGTPEAQGYSNLVCFRLSVSQVLEKAHEKGVSMTSFICAAVMMAIQNMQKEKVPAIKRRKPIKVLIPVNLRSLFESSSLRNFALYTTPEILPALGEYSFDEICKVVQSKLATEVTQKQMSMKIATNIGSERVMLLRLAPLFLKNFVMRLVYDTVGEKKSCLTISNLGAVRLPENMSEMIDRIDFILGVQRSTPNNLGVISFGDTVYLNFIRNIKESELEYHFYKVLRELGIDAVVESNKGGENVLY